jgi:type IV secretion system protein VirB4
VKNRAQIKKELRDEVPTSDYVPFGAHVAPNLIKLRNHAGYLAMWKVQGIAFETADPESIKSRRDQLNNFMGTIGGGHYAVWQHKIGRVVSERLQSTHTNPFCAEFDTRYYDSFDEYRMFSTELYVSIVFRPTLSKTANAFKSMRTSEKDYRESEKADIEQFEMVCKQVMNSLEPYDPTRLSTYVRDGVVCSALLQVYGYILNGVWEHVPLRTAAINQYLPASRLFFWRQKRHGAGAASEGAPLCGLARFSGIPQLDRAGNEQRHLLRRLRVRRNAKFLDAK